MDILLLLLTFPFAAFGLFLIGEHLFWFFTGDVVAGTIVKFSDKKSRGFVLPVVSFSKEEDEAAVEVQTEQIGRWSYLFNRPAEEELVPVIYKETERGIVARVYGFLNPVLGGLLLLPAFAVQAYRYGDVIAQSQFSYVVTFIVVLFGCWVALKLIQRS